MAEQIKLLQKAYMVIKFAVLEQTKPPDPLLHYVGPSDWLYRLNSFEINKFHYVANTTLWHLKLLFYEFVE